MAYLVGLAQHTPDEARGDPSVTYHLTPQEKREFVDGLDSGEFKPLKCVREHAGGENYVPPDENNAIYNVGEDKVFGHAYEGFLDDHDNLYLVSSLNYTHPDTDYINKVLDRHTDKAGKDPIPGVKRSRIGYSLGTDAIRQRKGPIIQKEIQHLGITEDPLYHDDGQTRIFFRTSHQGSLDNYLRENILDKPGFHVPKNMQRRLRDKDNIQRHTVGASAGSDSDLVTSPEPKVLHGAAPVPSVSPLPVPKMSNPDAMDISKTNETPAAAAPVSTPAAPPVHTDTGNVDRALLSSDYQKTLEQAGKLVDAPGVSDMSKLDAVDRYVEIFQHKKKLEQLQKQLGLFSADQSKVEKNVMKKLDDFEDKMGAAIEEEIKQTNILHETQKPIHITGARTDPLLNTQTLLSVHANAVSMSNQKEAQRKLSEDLAEARRANEMIQKKAAEDMALAQKKANEELAEVRRLNESLTSRMEKRPEATPAYQQPLPGSESGSLLKRNRDEGSSNSTGAPAVSKAIVDGIELPTQRFSMGASAGTSGSPTLQLSSLGGSRDLPMPVRVRYRTDLGSIPPNTANSLGFNLGMPVGMSEEQRKHMVMLNDKALAMQDLALVHNEHGQHTFVSRH